MRNADLSMHLKKSEGISTASASGNKSRLSKSDSCIAQFAKLFRVMHEPFVPPSALLVACPDMGRTHPSRYESKISKIKGIAAELYEVIPKDMHTDLKSSPAFRSMV